MKIDRAYKGVSEKELVLFSDGMCDGPMLEIGEQYLMYTTGGANGDVPARGCTRSRNAKFAEEDLTYLNSLGDAAPTATIYGKVVVQADEPGGDLPVSGALVELAGQRNYAATTDLTGSFIFSNLDPSKYTISVSRPGFRLLASGDEPPSAVVESRACAVFSLTLRKEWKAEIQGHLIRSNGEHGPAGISVSLLRTYDFKGKEQALPVDEAKTDEQGTYIFHEVAPGKYKVAIGLYQFPTASAPYPTIYWPAARSESKASSLEITDAANPQQYDFKLPPEPRSRFVTGIAVSPDGTPASGVQVTILALPDNNYVDDNSNRPHTDEAGHFSFTALEGIEYKINAVLYGLYGARSLHSADLSFSLSDSPVSLRLILDRPGRFDDDPVERRRQDQ